MAQTRPYIKLRGDGVYNPVVQSNPKFDMYVRGRLPDNISASYRKKQRLPSSTVKTPYIDKLQPAILNPKGNPNVASMMGSGKHKVKVRQPYVGGVQSKRLAFRNEVSLSAKHTPKPIKATYAKVGARQMDLAPAYRGKNAIFGK